MAEKRKLFKILSIIVYLTAFVSICLFVNTQMNKYNYWIYLYGDSAAAGSMVLVKVMASDGELVQRPEIYVNGTKQPSSLIDLRPDMKEIKVIFGTAETVGTTEAVFPLKYSYISSSRFVRKKMIHMLPNELQKTQKPAASGNRRIYLLPEQFRAVSEFENSVGLYCEEEGAPCSDDTIFINGEELNLNNGWLRFSALFGKDQGVNISFGDGTSTFAAVPYPGKMFKLYEESNAVTLAALTDVRNVHIDCFNQGKWVGTDIVAVSSSGLALPPVYKDCDTIQISRDSENPGTMYAVRSKVRTLVGNVDDPYYSPLAKVLPKFPESAQRFFITAYNSSFFQPLSLVFAGDRLEKEFLKQRNSKLFLYMCLLIISSIVGGIMFAYIMFSRIEVVEGEDGELITQSLGRQRFMAGAAVVFYTLFILGLIYLLNHLA